MLCSYVHRPHHSISKRGRHLAASINPCMHTLCWKTFLAWSLLPPWVTSAYFATGWYSLVPGYHIAASLFLCGNPVAFKNLISNLDFGWSVAVWRLHVILIHVSSTLCIQYMIQYIQQWGEGGFSGKVTTVEQQQLLCVRCTRKMWVIIILIHFICKCCSWLPRTLYMSKNKSNESTNNKPNYQRN